MTRATQVLMILIAASSSGCHGSTAPSPGGNTPVPTTQNLSGHVNDTAFRAVEGATIEVLDGPQAGLSMQSDSSGRFTYSGLFDSPVTVRAVKDRYITATATTVKVGNGVPYALIRLAASDPPLQLSGEYTLRVIADNSCSTALPSELRIRSYTASIVPTHVSSFPDGTMFTLFAGGATFLPGHDRFLVGVSSDAVGLIVYAGEDFGLVEEIDPTRFLAIGVSGAASGVTSPVSAITAPVSGDINYCATQTATGWNYNCTTGPRVVVGNCSGTHQLVLERR